MTFGMDELIDFSLISKKALKEFNVTETNTANLGKCFTIKLAEPLSLQEPFILVLKRPWDLKVFVHNDGDEFWLSGSQYGLITNMFQVNIKSNTEEVLTRLTVAEELVQHYPKTARPCNMSSSGNSKEAILKDAAYHRHSTSTKFLAIL